MLPFVVTLWWLLFFAAFGLCVGSFLNVVIYRLPLGLSIGAPLWSFCPHCRNRIHWYDNLPVVSYLRLGGRCRFCWMPIAVRYPIVEIMMGLCAVLLFDTFFIAQVRDGLMHGYDLNARVAEDWPVYLAHLVLFACLLAMSATDLEFYWIDIRYTYFAAGVGVLLHALWTPASSQSWGRPGSTTAAASVAAFVAFGVVWVVQYFFAASDEPEGHESESEPAPDEPETTDSESDHPRPVESDADDSQDRPQAALFLSIIVFLVLVMGALWGEIGRGATNLYGIRAAMPLAFFLAILLREASQARDSDTEVVEAIESEAHSARANTLIEFAALAPAVIAAAATIWYCTSYAESDRAIQNVLGWRPTHDAWRPLLGVATAVTGYTISAAVGWFVRVFANLAFGREAFATGDIHMMAAAGAVLGWQTVAMGFVVSCFLAMIGWVILLPFKRSRAIPLGPWLTLGFLTTVIFYQPLADSPTVKNLTTLIDLLTSPNAIGALP